VTAQQAEDQLRARIEQILLNGPRRYTREQAADAAGVSVEKAGQLWRALGFPHTADDAVVFTDADVDAIRVAECLVEYQVIDDEMQSTVTRMLGQTMSRLAEWQSSMLVSIVLERPEILEQRGDLADFVEMIVPLLEQVQVFVWRRHLAAFAGRVLNGVSEPQESRDAVVGFADISGYTSLTRMLAEAELATMLEGFEAAASDIVTDHRGRIIKTLGDEVLFVVDDAVDGALIAVDLLEHTANDERLPHLRIGLAAGTVLSRFGDVYGSTVNIASRLTSVARPGSVLVDRQLADALADHPGISLQRLRPVSVRGYSHLEPWRLRRILD
jgi:adenylate cyclase